MRLVRDHNAGAYAVSVPCLACGRMVQLADAIIDIDGPAFKAYYHESCAPQGNVQRCHNTECIRSECRAMMANALRAARKGE